MNQLTHIDMEYSNRRNKTKQEEFLDAMEEIIPWSYWGVDMIRPHYFTLKLDKLRIKRINQCFPNALLHGDFKDAFLRCYN